MILRIKQEQRYENLKMMEVGFRMSKTAIAIRNSRSKKFVNFKEIQIGGIIKKLISYHKFYFLLFLFLYHSSYLH